MDFLDEDTQTLAGQKYALISIVSPQSNQKSNISAMKIKGVFEHREDAEKYVKKLMQLDNTFDIFLVDMYKWLAIPPNVESIEAQEHQEKELNDIIKGHKEQQILAKSHFEERKRFEIEHHLKNLATSSSANVDSNIDLSDLRFNIGKPIPEDDFKKLNLEQSMIIDTKGKQKIV